MAQTSTATGRVPTTKTSESIEATIAAEWVEAKNDELAAGKIRAAASARRTAAGKTLDGLMAHGEVVTVHGNARYMLEVQDYQNVVASSVLAALRILRPELAGVIAELEARPENKAKPVHKVALKRVKA